jgi:uroporphyrinogen III methyltransferase/synthase
MTVYLVGAGPGDPGLLTVRGAVLMGRATTVLYDRLVSPRVLALASPSARLIDVGKRLAGEGGAKATQEEINALLVEAGRNEDVVVRLKGGDPFVFGRGGEEALALQAAGVAYEVVPGVSAALAAPAAAGVPLTHRHVSSSFAVVSGHAAETDGADDDLERLATTFATLVVLMGATTRRSVAERLLRAGRSPATPVLVVEAATTPEQSSIRTTLAELSEVAVSSPATIVVGDVASLRLFTYEDRSLFGRRIVVTREAGRNATLIEHLVEAGAEVVELPTHASAPPEDGGLALAAALGELERFEWVVVASARAVEALFGVLRDARALAGTKVAAVGPATAAALAERGVVADLVGTPGRGKGAAACLLERFPAPAGTRTGRVLLPRSAQGREELAEGLRRLGWEVEAVDAYRSVIPSLDPDALAALEGADAIVFASPSAVEGFFKLAGATALPATVVSIGPTTSAAARTKGVQVAAEAASPSPDDLVAALEAVLGPKGPKLSA